MSARSHRNDVRRPSGARGRRRPIGFRPFPDALEDRCLLTFLPPADYAIGGNPSAVAVADFNGDGKPDVVAAQSASTSNSVTVLLNNGDGTFQQGGTFAANQDPVAIVAADFNGDGRMDVAVANQLNNEVTVLLGNGDGTFQAPVAYAAGANPQGLAMADLNGDGVPDLIAADAGKPTQSPCSWAMATGRSSPVPRPPSAFIRRP